MLRRRGAPADLGRHRTRAGKRTPWTPAEESSFREVVGVSHDTDSGKRLPGSPRCVLTGWCRRGRPAPWEQLSRRPLCPRCFVPFAVTVADTAGAAVTRPDPSTARRRCRALAAPAGRGLAGFGDSKHEEGDAPGIGVTVGCGSRSSSNPATQAPPGTALRMRKPPRGEAEGQAAAAPP